MSAGSRPSPPPEQSYEPRYIAILMGPRRAAPTWLVRVRAAISRHGAHLVPRLERDTLLLMTDPADPRLRVEAGPGPTLVLLGTLFGGTGAGGNSPGPAEEVIARLFAQARGSCVAFAADAPHHAFTIARDPGGALPVHVVDAGGAAIVCDQLPPWLVRAIDRPFPVDRPMLANALAWPLLTTHRSLLRNVHLLPPGAALRWEGRPGACRQLWPPPGCGEPRPDAAERLRAAVLDSVLAHGRLYRRLLLELSGGLDSAIVLGALAKLDARIDLTCINLVTPYAGGDERATARDAAGRWSAELVEVALDEEEADFRGILLGDQPVQPVLYGLDPLLEAAVGGAARALGKEAILTGQGGDAIFFQMPTDKVAIDHRRRFGMGSFFSDVAMDAARRTRSSIWRVQARMLRDLLAGSRLSDAPAETGLLGPAALAMLDPALGRHPWLGAASSLPPGTQLQLAALANCQLFNGPTLRGQAALLVHPLMSQSVMEAGLAVPSYQLSRGMIDRALARSLFADLLPASIARRRGKGEASTYYRRAIVANLGFLRPHLLEGCLAGNGLLDPGALDRLLCEDTLLWSGEGRRVTLLASLESWARHWGL